MSICQEHNPALMLLDLKMPHVDGFQILREIGEMLALTESRVCQIHSNVMGRLKSLLGQKQGTLLM